MRADACDLAVIGGGSAGLTAATIAGRLGARVVLIDKERLGGDCLYYGCVPSKALIRCAKVAETARRARTFGVSTGPVESDFAKVLEYVWGAVAAVGEHETPAAMAEHGVEVALGGARFLSPTRILVGAERVVEARRTIVAVGSHAVAPELPGLADVGYIDHVKVFHLTHLPRRIAVVGGGPIGVELGQALARLGAEITILQRPPQVLERDDPELTTLLAAELARELTLQCGAEVVSFRRGSGGKVVVFRKEGREETLEVDELLVAVGRRANLTGLDLDAAGVRVERGTIAVDEHLRTSAANIWACGDCTGGYQFTHFAEAQARAATRNALFRGRARFAGANVPWVTFTDPELAHVGLTESAAKRDGREVRVYRWPYERVDRAVCEGEPRGLAKLVCTPRGKILGASILGPHAGEAISNVVIAMDAGLDLGRLGQTIFPYPTMNRVVRRLADQRFLEEGASPWLVRLFGRFSPAGSS